jgi:hypothetical protein
MQGEVREHSQVLQEVEGWEGREGRWGRVIGSLRSWMRCSAGSRRRRKWSGSRQLKWRAADDDANPHSASFKSPLHALVPFLPHVSLVFLCTTRTACAKSCTAPPSPAPKRCMLLRSQASRKVEVHRRWRCGVVRRSRISILRPACSRAGFRDARSNPRPRGLVLHSLSL